jgi:hypothetical protein
MAPVLDVPASDKLGNAASNLRTGEPGHLGQIPPQRAPVGPVAAHIAEMPERVGHPVIGRMAIGQGKRNGFVALHKGAYLRQCL